MLIRRIRGAVGDIKLSWMDIKRWQQRWVEAERGRKLYQHRTTVGFAPKVAFNSPLSGQWICQLRTGYTKLKGYMKKVGQSDDKLWACCGDEETAKYHLQFPQYQNENAEVVQTMLSGCIRCSPIPETQYYIYFLTLYGYFRRC